MGLYQWRSQNATWSVVCLQETLDVITLSISFVQVRDCCCCSVTKSCLTLQPHGLQHARPLCPCLLEFAWVHVHWIGDAIQPSHPLPPFSPFAFNLYQQQGLFQWVSSSHQVAKVLELQLRISPSHEYSGLVSFRIDWYELLQSKGLSRVFSSTTVWKH